MIDDRIEKLVLPSGIPQCTVRWFNPEGKQSANTDVIKLYNSNIWGFKAGFITGLSDPGWVSQNHNCAPWIKVHVQAGWIHSQASEPLLLQGRNHGVEAAGYPTQGILQWVLCLLILFFRNFVIKPLEDNLVDDIRLISLTCLYYKYEATTSSIAYHKKLETRGDGPKLTKFAYQHIESSLIKM